MTRDAESPGAARDGALAYWMAKLAELPPAAPPPGARTPVDGADAGATRRRVRRRVPDALAQALGAAGCPPSETVLAGLLALNLRTTRQRDQLVGVAGPEGSLPLRVEVDPRRPFGDLLATTRAALAEARANAAAPAAIARVLGVAEDALFRVLVVTGGGAPTPPELVLSVEEDAGPELVLEHDTATVDGDAAEAALGHLETLLAAALGAGKDVPLARLPLLTEGERHRILVEWNDTEVEFPRSACLHELFEQRVAESPDAVAAVFRGERLSYRALDERADALAWRLRELGVEPEVLVGISAERSFEMVVGLLAIAKAGGAYVPLDPSYPRERLEYLVRDSRVPVLLTQRHLADALPGREGMTTVLLEDAPAAKERGAPESGVTAENLCYVIYTSGSTGEPKGVMLDHRGRVNNFLDFNRRFAVGPGDALIALASLSFDMCAYDVFGILAAGATIVLPDPGEMQDPAAWARLMNAQAVTVWHTAPAVLKMLVDHVEARPALAPRALRLVLLGGDWIPVGLPDRLRALVPGATVVSMGGATECSMDSTLFVIERVDPEWRSIPYGEPMKNQLAYVLDEELQALPVGVPGELYLGGVGVGRGYLERPELSAERFVADPFAGASARMYRTGDLARWMPDGNLELLGRLDNQVKIRGHRIELGEIETLLVRHPDVREGVVAAREDASGEKRLVAYVVPAGQGSEGLGPELRRHLAASLPETMVPAAVMLLERMPLSPNGKVDRKALPAPEPARTASGPCVAPRDPVEALVAGVWADVLEVERVGVLDAFLELGGHSVLAARIQARLSEIFPFELPTAELREGRTVAEAAGRLRLLGERSGVPAEEVCLLLQQIDELSDEEVATRLASPGPEALGATETPCKT